MSQPAQFKFSHIVAKSEHNPTTTYVSYIVFNLYFFLKCLRQLTNKNLEGVFLQKAANSSTRHHHMNEHILC